MKTIRIVSTSLLLWAAAMFAETVPGGTLLPVALSKSIDSAHARPGQTITAGLMQTVTLPSGTKIPRGAKVIGQVVQNPSGTAPGKSAVSLRFDRLVADGQSYDLTTNLRAIANFVAVNDAYIPTAGPDEGSPRQWWTTQQVGGDQMYGSGEVLSNGRKVGNWTPNGALALVSTREGLPCRGAMKGAADEQSLWVFSADACGVYGFSGLGVQHAGRHDPVGTIVLTAKGRVHVPAGSGLLLRVDKPDSDSVASK